MKLKEGKKAGQILGSCQSTEKSVDNEFDGDTSRSWCPRNSPLEFGEKTANSRSDEELRTSNHSIVKIS